MSYSDELKRGSIVENWLFTFNNDNSGALRFAFSDVTESGNFYHGVILNKPSIRESINLSDSTSKTSNISITIPDFPYQGVPVSEELFGGSNHYINQTVSVYSLINSQTLQIGSFRLIDINSDGDKLSLSMTSQMPWDFIEFPQDRSDTNNYIPTVYGAFTPNTCREGAYAINDSLALFPVKVDYVTQQITCVAPRSLNGLSGNEGRLHFWDKTAEQFCPMLNNAGTAYHNNISISNNLIDYVTAPLNLHRAYMAKPHILKKDFTTGSFISWSDTANMGNAIDDRYNTPSTATFTEAVISLTVVGFGGGVLQGGEVLFLTPLSFEGQAQHLTLTGTAHIADIIQSGNAYTTAGRINYIITPAGTVSGGFLFRILNADDDNTTFTGDTVLATEVTADDATAYNNNDGWDEDDIQILAYISFSDDSFSGTSNAQADFRIYDVVQTVRAKYEEIESKISSAVKTDTFYLGSDGLTHGITGLVGNSITEVHEAHLDLLNRFAGVDVATNPATNIDGWSDLDSSKDWAIRWWTLEPVELKKTLEKLQYEGGFIFRFKADGSPQYIHIKDSHTADETLTKLDVSNITIKPSSFGNLLTQMDVSYEKHPAETTYITTVESKNATSRTNWNVLTKENIKQVNLDAYVSPPIPATPSTNPNDDFYTYYDNIFGDIKLIVSGTIVNPKYYNLEVGKVLAFTDMYPIKAFNTSWSGLKFMITGLTRTAGTLKFEAREI